MYPITPTITNHVEGKGPAPRIADSLEGLPAEILLQISGTLPSLDVLWNLMRASPIIWRLFDCYHNTMIESVLSGPNSITPSNIRKLIRAMVFMRSGQLPFVNLEEFQIFMHRLLPTDHLPNALRQRMYNRGPDPFHGKFDETKQYLGPGSLVQTTAHTARSVVATASHISALSQSCLSSHIARLRHTRFKPSNPAHWPPDDNIALYHDQLGGPIVVGSGVPLVDMGQPTEPEETRVVRAMWVIQMVCELKYFVEWRAKTISWSRFDVYRLLESKLFYLVYFSFGPPGEFPFDPTREVKAATQYLDTRGEYRRDIYYRLPRAPTPSAVNRG
ncbi:unnamed protein product [Fusarium equiseti]|uniref:F-box domain-containing protein n=1 Tax=Fusarium equiseti TaxID=61235 RepID=A0A8J2IF29_FUSEQ|nr:unnamed protein product [Fusarium equiseti]